MGWVLARKRPKIVFAQKVVARLLSELPIALPREPMDVSFDVRIADGAVPQGIKVFSVLSAVSSVKILRYLDDSHSRYVIWKPGVKRK